MNNFQVLLYTVTSSGIVSERRFEQFLRTNPPRLDLAVGQLSSRSATIQAFLFRPPPPPPKRRNQTMDFATSSASPPSPPSSQCQLQVVVTEAFSGELLLERYLPLANQLSPSLALDGLKPWRKYAASAQVILQEGLGFFEICLICRFASHPNWKGGFARRPPPHFQVICGPFKNYSSGASSSPCPPKMHSLGRVEFRTEPAPPGPVVSAIPFSFFPFFRFTKFPGKFQVNFSALPINA